MTDQLVSVIIAVQNGERYLRSALESILVQAYAPIEILLVDSHSTDRTVAIARRYPHVRCLSQVQRGIADARNLGIAAAKGALLAFLSHDDIWASDKLRSQLAHMASFPHLQYTVGRAKFFMEPGLTPPPGFRSEWLIGDHVAHIPETLLAKRSVFEKIGMFDTQLTTSEDVDWFARAQDQHVPYAVVPKVLLHKRVHDSNSSLNDPLGNQRLLRVIRQSIERKRKVIDNAVQGSIR